MKEFLEFIQSIKWHVSVVIVIWLALRSWVAVVRMRLEYSRSIPMAKPDPKYNAEEALEQEMELGDHPNPRMTTRPALPGRPLRRTLGSRDR